MVLNCVVCGLQEDWLWVIVQVQQSLMVASSDFPFTFITKFPWNLKNSPWGANAQFKSLGSWTIKTIFREGSRGRHPKLAPHCATPGATLWVASYLSIWHFLFLSQTKHSFPERVPGVFLQGWCLVVLPRELPVSGFIFPIWYYSLLSILPSVFKMKIYQSYKISISISWAMTKVSTKINAFARELNSNILD